MRRLARRSVSAAFLLATSLVLAPALAQKPPGPPPTSLPAGAQPQTPLGVALAAATATDYARAEQLLLAIRGGGEQPTAQLALARIMLEQGRFADADHYAQQAQADRAQSLYALALRGRILFAQGKSPDAIALLEPQKDAPDHGGMRVRLALAEIYIASGRRSDAEPLLQKFSDDWDSDVIKQDDAEGTAMLGRAKHLARLPKSANEAFVMSEKLDAKNVDALLWHADLFLDKYDTGKAQTTLKEVLEISPKRADAMVMMARAALDDSYDFDEASKLTKTALEINPKHTGAYAIRAGIALRDLDIAASEAALAQGFAINPNDLELWSVRGATRFLADDKSGYETAKTEALKRNPQYSQFFGIVGDFAEWEHRYDDIVTMMQEAVVVDPNDGKAWAQLGLTQTRGGDEKAGVQSLETSWKFDKFNVRVYNTLEMLYTRWIPRQYQMGSEGVFKIRYPNDERALLERYVPRFLEKAFGSMKARYDFAPTTPVQVELYADRQAFSVRTSGLPNIGIQGVCFGRVVASMSPKSEPFNWGNVLWHELGHVFAIQLSKNHVPRWFTEGLSEYETIVRRPEWQRELDPEFYNALTHNLLPGAVDMNKAFTHQGELDVTTAYYAASQMVVYTAETYGFSKIVTALSLWGQGVRTGDVIQRAFGVAPEAYDAGFRTWALARLSRYRGQYNFEVKPKDLDEAQKDLAKTPQSAHAHVVLALALVRAEKADEAKKEVEAALKLDPNDKDAHFLAWKLSEDVAAQKAHIDAIRRAGGDGYEVEMALAKMALGSDGTSAAPPPRGQHLGEQKKDPVALRAALESAHRWDPKQSEPLSLLYKLAKEEHRDADGLNALREMAPLEAHDPDVWRLLLSKLVAQKLWTEARSVGESALFVDMENASVHVNYARALAALSDHATAIYELDSALLCDAKPPEQATAQALLAREFLATGDRAQAKQHLDLAVQLDPENGEAKTVKIP